MDYVNPITAAYSDVKSGLFRNREALGILAVALGALTVFSSTRANEPTALVLAKSTAVMVAVPVTAALTLTLTSLVTHSSILAMQIFGAIHK